MKEKEERRSHFSYNPPHSSQPTASSCTHTLSALYAYDSLFQQQQQQKSNLLFAFSFFVNLFLLHITVEKLLSIRKSTKTLSLSSYRSGYFKEGERESNNSKNNNKTRSLSHDCTLCSCGIISATSV